MMKGSFSKPGLLSVVVNVNVFFFLINICSLKLVHVVVNKIIVIFSVGLETLIRKVATGQAKSDQVRLSQFFWKCEKSQAKSVF